MQDLSHEGTSRQHNKVRPTFFKTDKDMKDRERIIAVQD